MKLTKTSVVLKKSYLVAISVVVILLLGNAPLYSSSYALGNDAQKSSTTIVSVDNNVFGSYTAIAIGKDKFPIIAYTDNLDAQLRLVHCTSLSCSTHDTPRNLFSSGGFGGAFTSIKIGKDKFPIIAFVEQATGFLDVIHCTDMSCSSSDLPKTLVNEIVGGSSMAIENDGLPVIAYQSFATGDLKLIHCKSSLCDTFDTSTALDNMGTVETTPSIDIGKDGFPVISYQSYAPPNQINSILKLVHCIDKSCNKFDEPVTIDSMGAAASSPSVTKDKDGFPVISYRQWVYNNFVGSGVLRVVHCTSDSCNTFDLPSTLDSSVDVGGYTPISIGKDHLPIISYQDFSSGNLRVIHCTDMLCSTFDNPIIIDSPFVAYYISNAIEQDGSLVISYDGSTADEKVARVVN